MPTETAYMLGFTAVFLASTLGGTLFVLFRIHQRISRLP